MSKFKEINLENGMPSSGDALITLKSAMSLAKQNNVGCLLIIHGYGSSGKGGVIRSKVRQWLNAQLRKGEIKSLINGEDFEVTNFKALELKNKYKQLECIFNKYNHGTTVVEL